jgi:hypothetical protein
MQMLRILRAACVAAVLTMLVVNVLPPRMAAAHETRAIASGQYELVVGFIVEPALEGQKNGLDLRVRVPGTPPTPVLGVEKTLQWEITHVGTDKTATFPIRTIFNDPGHYTADLILTAPGQYRFRFFGTVEGVTVNETFISGERFNNVEPTDELQFPEKVAQVRSIEGAVEDAQLTADDAASAADNAQLLSLVAVGVAFALGGGAIAIAMRRR